MEKPKADPAYARPSGKTPFEDGRKGFNREQVFAYLRLVDERISDLETRLREANADLDDRELSRA